LRHQKEEEAALGRDWLFSARKKEKAAKKGPRESGTLSVKREGRPSVSAVRKERKGFSLIDFPRKEILR